MTSKGVRLLDGSFAAALSELGFNSDEHKLWTGAANKLEPQLVQKVYEGFLEAGVDIITTNTYHSLIPLIKKYYPGHTVMEFNEPAVALLHQAIEVVEPAKPVEIYGSIGCYGASLRDASEYTGTYVDDLEKDMFRDMADYYINEIAKLEMCGIKKMIIETVPTLLEVDSILKATDTSPSEFIISFSCKDGENLNHGEKLEIAVQAVVSSRKIKGIGINCTAADHISSLLESIQGITKNKQIFVYPNDGYGKIKLADLTEEELRVLFLDWIEKGATVIGGCCQVSTDTIRKMRKVLDSI